MEDRTVSLGRYIWASSHVHAILVARGKASAPLYRLRCVGKGDDLRASALERYSLRHGQIFSYLSAYGSTSSARERPGMISPSTPSHSSTSAWRDDLYYGAIQLFAALAVCHFRSESVALRLLTLKTQGSAFWTVCTQYDSLVECVSLRNAGTPYTPSDNFLLKGALRQRIAGSIGTIEQVGHICLGLLLRPNRRFVSLVCLECLVDTL